MWAPQCGGDACTSLRSQHERASLKSRCEKTLPPTYRPKKNMALSAIRSLRHPLGAKEAEIAALRERIATLDGELSSAMSNRMYYESKAGKLQNENMRLKAAQSGQEGVVAKRCSGSSMVHKEAAILDLMLRRWHEDDRAELCYRALYRSWDSSGQRQRLSWCHESSIESCSRACAATPSRRRAAAVCAGRLGQHPLLLPYIRRKGACRPVRSAYLCLPALLPVSARVPIPRPDSRPF